ncbi:MAG: hypothetical protein DWQ37_10245 [Planctomycetota bacterium]|nr:MAG: hypothetical protein DWQ37_10245 [Planctomycetota bacterium]
MDSQHVSIVGCTSRRRQVYSWCGRRCGPIPNLLDPRSGRPYAVRQGQDLHVGPPGLTEHLHAGAIPASFAFAPPRSCRHGFLLEARRACGARDWPCAASRPFPEPSTFVLGAIGFVGLYAVARRRVRSTC